jgi:hypothetical protein
MKFRKDFVTNSSSSSFIVSINFKTKKGKTISFTGNGGTPECGSVDYFDGDAEIFLSPKQLANAKDMDELIELLVEGVIDHGYNDDCETKIFEKSNPKVPDIYQEFEDESDELDELDEDFEDMTFDAYDFILELKKKIKSPNDIATVTISGVEENYLSYAQTYTYDKINDKYTGTVHGEPMEIDGASGGWLSIPDEDECDIEYESVEDE